MSLTFKLLSLAIRTAAKPIGNYIKRQAKEHDGFRRFAVAQAQRVHRIDMRMRLGILHDPAAQERMHEREQKAAEEKKRKAETPTVRTEVEQKKYEEDKAKEEAEGKDGKKKEEPEKPYRVKIKPLSEARAIELGANFFSEAFIFGVAAGLLIWDAWRSRRKETERRDMVKERLDQLEAEVVSLRSQLDPDLETLHEFSERMKEAKKRRSSWASYLGWNQKSEEQTEDVEPKQEEAPSKAKADPVDKTSEAKKIEGVKETSEKKPKVQEVQNPTASKPTERIVTVDAAPRGR